jgi:hypothetical protein
MDKLTATLNGVKIERFIPSSWDDVTYSQMLEIGEIGDDPANLLAYFTLVDIEILKKAKIKNMDAVFKTLDFLRTVPIPVVMPETILGFAVPKDLEYECLAQYEDIKAVVKGYKDMSEADILGTYPIFCATYAMPEYDGLKVDEFSKQFFNAPCGEVLAIGNFTLQKWSGSNGRLNPTSPQGATPLKKFRLGIKGWLINMAFTLRYYLWKRRQGISDQNS